MEYIIYFILIFTRSAMTNYIDFVPNIKYPYFFTDPNSEKKEK